MDQNSPYLAIRLIQVALKQHPLQPEWTEKRAPPMKGITCLTPSRIAAHIRNTLGEIITLSEILHYSYMYNLAISSRMHI